MQKEELKDQFTDLLSKFTTYFGKYLPDDVMESLKTLSSKQQSEISKIIYDVMFDDMDLAKKRNVPICQDTGVIQYFVKCGANFPLLGDLNPACAKRLNEPPRMRRCGTTPSKFLTKEIPATTPACAFPG